jgi:hypothetical protein
MTENKPGRPSYHDTQMGDQTDRKVGKPQRSERPDADNGKPGRAGARERENQKR